MSNEVFADNDDGLEKFCKTTMDTLNSFAPIKKKYARGNQMPFMTKNLSKEIMTRSRLRNKYLKHKNRKKIVSDILSKEVNMFFFLRKTKMNY